MKKGEDKDLLPFTYILKSIANKLLLSRACVLFDFVGNLQNKNQIITNHFWHRYLIRKKNPGLK